MAGQRMDWEGESETGPGRESTSSEGATLALLREPGSSEGLGVGLAVEEMGLWH